MSPETISPIQEGIGKKESGLTEAQSPEVTTIWTSIRVNKAESPKVFAIYYKKSGTSATAL